MYINWLNEYKLPRGRVGGKAASLSVLAAAGFPVPSGFAVNVDGYRHYLKSSGLEGRLNGLIGTARTAASEARVTAGAATQAFQETPLPVDLCIEVALSYAELEATVVACAVRSSAIGEDGVKASFAGLYDSFLGVRGIDAVLKAIRDCYMSLWSERALRYRLGQGAADDVMAVVVMGLVQADASGVAFTAHPVTGAADRVVINSSWGLGEAVVSGIVTPDSFVVQKSPLRLIERAISQKEVAIFAQPDGVGTVECLLVEPQASAPSLSDDDACLVADLAVRVERHYGRPQDVEFALADGNVVLLQSRPITTLG